MKNKSKRAIKKTSHRGLLLFSAVLIMGGLLLLDNAFRTRYHAPIVVEDTDTAEAIRTGSSLMPSYSSSTEEMLLRQPEFSALISYTDTGFEPRTLTVSPGSAVRFVNNAMSRLWVASRGASEGGMYPQTNPGCGPSDIDSCGGLQTQDVWQFTFTVPGVWRVTNALNDEHDIVIVVQ
jgi:plastocyanin